MPCSRSQVDKGRSVDFYFKGGLLQKRLKPKTFPQPALPPCGCLRRTQGRCSWCFQGGPGCSAVKPIQERTGPELSTVLYLTWWLSYQKSILQISQTHHTAPRYLPSFLYFIQQPQPWRSGTASELCRVLGKTEAVFFLEIQSKRSQARLSSKEPTASWAPRPP